MLLSTTKALKYVCLCSGLVWNGTYCFVSTWPCFSLTTLIGFCIAFLPFSLNINTSHVVCRRNAECIWRNSLAICVLFQYVQIELNISIYSHSSQSGVHTSFNVKTAMDTQIVEYFELKCECGWELFKVDRNCPFCYIHIINLNLVICNVVFWI